VDSRKTWGIFLIVAGVIMYRAAGMWVAHLVGTGASDTLLAAAHFTSALAAVPMILGLYFLVTQGKNPPP
jgi:hypothetical protein